MRGLPGRVVIVAGGGSGIGAATALRLAVEGATVVVGDLDGANAAAVADRLATPGLAVQFDIADEDAVDALVSQTIDAFGRLDAVHVNAADLSPSVIGLDTDVLEVPLDVFDRTIHVNLRGHVLVTRRVVPEFVERGGGALVYTSSAAAFIGGGGPPAYAMSKSGLNALVRHVSSRWGKDGIRANGVAPGYVITEKLAASGDNRLQDHALSLVHAPRLGTPGDIAAAVAFLVSDDAAWITGQVISVDGGTTTR